MSEVKQELYEDGSLEYESVQFGGFDVTHYPATEDNAEYLSISVKVDLANGYKTVSFFLKPNGKVEAFVSEWNNLAKETTECDLSFVSVEEIIKALNVLNAVKLINGTK